MIKQIFILFILLPIGILAQFPSKDTATQKKPMLTKVYDQVEIIPNFQWRYKIALKRVRRVYPLALEAARVIDSLNQVLEHTKGKGKRRRIERNTKKKLDEEFKFMIKDLYQSEGRVLTKLIYRESGMTVRDILKEYRSGFSAFMYSTMAGFFNQELDMEYHPENNSDDYIIECVIRDIQLGKVDFNPYVKGMTKSEYKISMKEYRQDKRAHRKEARKEKRKKKKKLN